MLQVYADLSSRAAAFNRVREFAGRSLPRGGAEAEDLIRCLGNGAAPARSYAADLAAARHLAAATRPVTLAPASSRRTAEMAIRAYGIALHNNGCDSCGGYVPRPVVLYRIVWKHIVLAPGSVWDGTIGGMPFTARYSQGHGWTVGLDAC